MTWLPISLKNAAKCDKWYQLQNHSITESLNANGAWEKLLGVIPVHAIFLSVEQQKTTIQTCYCVCVCGNFKQRALGDTDETHSSACVYSHAEEGAALFFSVVFFVYDPLRRLCVCACAPSSLTLCTHVCEVRKRGNYTTYMSVQQQPKTPTREKDKKGLGLRSLFFFSFPTPCVYGI